MRVLLLTQVLPYPPDSGPKVKTWNVIQSIADKHEVTLVSFTRGDQSADVKRLERHCRAVYTVPMHRGVLSEVTSILNSVVTNRPWLIVRDDRAAMRRLVDRVAAERHFDVVHADQVNMAQYAYRVPGALRILDAHNALWLLYRRLRDILEPGLRKVLLSRDWRLLKRYEGRVCREFDAVLSVSESDAAALQEAAAPGKPNTRIVPIAVDTEEVVPIRRDEDADHVLHVGTMYWPPNVDAVMWFAREVWPILRRSRPASRFDAVGAQPPREVMALSRDESGITVPGYVSDLAPYLRQCGVFVVPLRAGGGMRVKILTALAQGLPVVSTTLGCEGIAVMHGRDVLIADTPAEFAAAVLQVLEDPRLSARLSENGRRLAESTYDYRGACRPLDSLYRELARRPE